MTARLDFKGLRIRTKTIEGISRNQRFKVWRARTGGYDGGGATEREAIEALLLLLEQRTDVLGSSTLTKA
jgi:hypothetical protein